MACLQASHGMVGRYRSNMYQRPQVLTQVDSSKHRSLYSLCSQLLKNHNICYVNYSSRNIFQVRNSQSPRIVLQYRFVRYAKQS